MPTAVIRINIDTDRTLTLEAHKAGLDELASSGLQVIAAPFEHLTPAGREIELLVDAASRRTDEEYAAQCVAAFGVPVEVGVTTFVSRGTDEDVHGVLARFSATGDVVREAKEGWDLVTVTLPLADQNRIPESRLHTALEAALNCEVNLRFA